MKTKKVSAIFQILDGVIFIAKRFWQERME